MHKCVDVAGEMEHHVWLSLVASKFLDFGRAEHFHHRDAGDAVGGCARLRLMGSAQARRKPASCTRDRQTACKINVAMADL